MNLRAVLRALRTPVVLLVLLVFVAWAAKWSFTAATEPLPEPAPSPCVVQEVGKKLTPENVYVRVYNGSDVSGLAKRYAAILRADGFNVFLTTNTAEPTWTTSYVIGYSEDSPEVKLVRQAFKSIKFKADGRVDHTVDVILGSKQPKVLNSPKFNVPLEDGTACIPQVTVVDSEA